MRPHFWGGLKIWKLTLAEPKYNTIHWWGFLMGSFTILTATQFFRITDPGRFQLCLKENILSAEVRVFCDYACEFCLYDWFSISAEQCLDVLFLTKEVRITKYTTGITDHPNLHLTGNDLRGQSLLSASSTHIRHPPARKTPTACPGLNLKITQPEGGLRIQYKDKYLPLFVAQILHLT